MELRRFFRAPLLLIAVAVLLLLFVLDYANSGSSYKQVDTSQIVTAIDQGQVKSALIVDKNQTIQITTNSGQKLESSWVSGQGLQLQNKLQQQVDKGNLKDGYNVSIPKSNALLDLIPRLHDPQEGQVLVDGTYYVKVTATDAPSNSPATALVVALLILPPIAAAGAPTIRR